MGAASSQLVPVNTVTQAATSKPAITAASTTSNQLISRTTHYKTPWATEGDGSPAYLDQHDIKCDAGSSINSAHLERDYTGKSRYAYTCTDTPGTGKIATTMHTEWNDNGNGNAVYLDRHDVKCAVNHILSQIKLTRSADDKQYRYDYDCVESAAPLKCEDRATPWNDEGEGYSAYLDRHDVKCNDNEALSRLHLQRDGNGKYHYEFSCCQSAG